MKLRRSIGAEFWVCKVLDGFVVMTNHQWIVIGTVAAIYFIAVCLVG